MEDKNNIQFELYLSGKMEEAQALAFENSLRNDEKLKAEFEEFKIVYDAIGIVGDNLLKDEFENIHQEMEVEKHETKVLPINKFRWSRVAAALVIVLGCTYFLLSNKQTDKANLYAEHFETYAAPSWSRSDDNTEQHWETFIESYVQEDFDAALISLQRIDSTSMVPSYLTSFYEGLCYQLVDTPDFEKSVIEFEKVLRVDNDYHDTALWYSAMASLHLGDYQAAKMKLEKLIESSNYKKDECEIILESLSD